MLGVYPTSSALIPGPGSKQFDLLLFPTSATDCKGQTHDFAYKVRPNPDVNDTYRPYATSSHRLQWKLGLVPVLTWPV